MDKTLIYEADEIMKIYFVTYTPVIDLILEYISPQPWYCPWAKSLGNTRALVQYIPVFSQ